MMDTGNPFKGRHSQGEIILLCVRWYLRYNVGSTNLHLRKFVDIAPHPNAAIVLFGNV